jgi:hypothetical protein
MTMPDFRFKPLQRGLTRWLSGVAVWVCDEGPWQQGLCANNGAPAHRGIRARAAVPADAACDATRQARW